MAKWQRRRLAIGTLAAVSLWVAIGAPNMHASAGADERVLQEGRIVVGVHNRAPWGYRDNDTGEATGWHPDLVRAAFAELGVDEVELRVTEFGALIPGLLAGRFDAIASGLAITPERCRQVAFGDPDLMVPDAAIVLAGNPEAIDGYEDIAAKSHIIMGAGRGSVVAQNAIAAGVPDSRILLFPDIEANVAALRAGRIQVAVFSSPTVIGLLAGNTGAGLERAVPFATLEGADNYAAIAFRRGDESLRDLYNLRLAALRADGTLAAIKQKYGFGDPETVPDGLDAAQLCDGQD